MGSQLERMEDGLTRSQEHHRCRNGQEELGSRRFGGPRSDLVVGCAVKQPGVNDRPAGAIVPALATSARASSAEASLVRSIGTFGLAASIVNVTIGGGIFRLPADMAATLGPTAPIAYLLCAVAMGLIVLCMAEAGSRVSLTGGPYAYVEVAFGPFLGFLAGFLLWMVLTFVMAAVATVLVASLGALVPAAVVTGSRRGRARRYLRVLRDGQHPRRRPRRRRQYGTHRRQTAAAAPADRRRTVRGRLRQPGDRRSACSRRRSRAAAFCSCSLSPESKPRSCQAAK